MPTLNFIITHAWPYRWYLFGVMLATCMTTLSNLFVFTLIKKIIDAVTLSSYHEAWKFCFFYGVIICIAECFWALNDYCLTYYTPRLKIHVTEYVMQQLYGFDYSFFQNNLTGSLIAKLGDVFSLITDLIFKFTDKFIHFLLLVMISMYLLYQVAPIFAFIMILWISFFFFVAMFYMKKTLFMIQHYSDKKSLLFGSISDYITNILSIKMFSTRAFEIARLEKDTDAFINASDRQGLFFTTFYFFQGIFKDFYMISFVVFLILRYQQSLISAGDFSFVFMVNYNMITNVYNFLRDLRESILKWGSLKQAIEIFNHIPEIEDKPGAKNIEINKGKIIFDSVSFHYKNTTLLFENISITIEGGKKVGLVGYSGRGKSSFINLILRLYEVSSGHVTIDGQNISDVTQDSLREKIAIIPQDTTLFHRSIMDNIRYGNINASDEDVINAAKKARADEFISKLPQRYQSLVGERGVKLSGGQRQRIAIARAFLKNAPILILDEATSQMDSLTEKSIQESLLELSQYKTTIVIAHRLSTLLFMDHILVFDQGKIIADGTHEDLLQKSDLYKALWNTQNGGILADGNER